MRKKELAGVLAFKAESSGPNGNCVGYAPLGDGTIALFDTAGDGDSPVLRFGRSEWGAFLDAVRTGRFIPLPP